MTHYRRKLQSLKMKKLWKNPEWRENTLRNFTISINESYTKSKKNESIRKAKSTDESKKKASDTVKRNWNDPEMRAYIIQRQKEGRERARLLRMGTKVQ